MKDRAYAKINLALNVIGRRENGYHNINSIMVPINFYDELEINIMSDDIYKCNKTFIKFNEKNSIIKMIKEIKEKFNINDHYYINLKKTVPMQAGLGGGTSDAASVLRIFKKLYNLNLTAEDEKELCTKVGADVLFNYYNKPAMVSGIGDKIEIFNIKKEYTVLIVKPRLGISTKLAYEKLNIKTCEHPDIEKLKIALINGDNIENLLQNSLEQPALKMNKDIKRIKDELKENGAKNVLMSGSGSSVFAISENYNEIAQLQNKIENNSYYIRLTKTMTN